MSEPKIVASDFGKVAVLMGGWANEREISLKSGRAVLQALQNQGVDAQAVDVGPDLLQQLSQGNFDRAFNMVHGRGGEDGLLQAVLGLLQLPFTGSDILGSAVAMDKYRTKLIWRGLSLPTPDFVLLETANQLAEVEQKLGFPVIVKAALEGSSIGIAHADNAHQLQEAWVAAKACDSHVIAEQWIEGTEYTASILGDQALPLIRLETGHAFYDYAAKYQSNDTRYIVPCGLDAPTEQSIQKLSLKAFQAVDGHGWGRVDLICDATGQPWLIEVNTVPGMTEHSLVPMAAAAVGVDFNQLVWRILAQTIQQSGQPA